MRPSSYFIVVGFLIWIVYALLIGLFISSNVIRFLAMLYAAVVPMFFICMGYTIRKYGFDERIQRHLDWLRSERRRRQKNKKDKDSR